MPTARMIDVARVDVSEYLPTRWFQDLTIIEMARALRERQDVRPLHVVDGNVYGVLADELLWRAARAAGLAEIPALIHTGTPSELRQVALREHMRSSDPDPFAAAELMQRLGREGVRQSAIGELIGWEQSDVAHLVRLHKRLSSNVKQWIRAGTITQGHGRILARLPHARQDELAQQARQGRWSVRRLETAIKGKGNAAQSPKDRDVERLEEELSDAVGNKVVIDYAGEGGGGEVRIAFHNLDEADGIFERLRQPPPPRDPFY